MPSPVRLNLQAPSRGWMDVVLTVGETRLEFSASYIPSDSVRDLAEAVSGLLRGVKDQTVSWNTEPIRYEFRFTTTGQHIRLEVYQFADHRQSGGVAVAAVVEETRVLCLALWRTLRRLQGQLSEAAYATAWQHPFPSEVVRRITSQLDLAG